MSAEETPSPVQSEGGWECKPRGPSTQRLVVMAFVGGVICGLLPLLWLYGNVWIWSHAAAVLCGLLVLAGVSLFLLPLALSRWRDYLYMDDRRIVGYCRLGRLDEEMWDVRIATIKDIAFTGGSFCRGEFAARIRGRGFIVRGRNRFLPAWERIVDRLTLDAALLRLHPRLLERLIALAEPKCDSARRRKALERARQFVSRAASEALPAVSRAEIGSPETLLDSLAAKLRKYKRFAQFYAFAANSLLFIAFSAFFFFHLRGSLLDLLMPPLALCLLGSPGWAWPVTRPFRSRWIRLAIHIALNAAIVLMAVFIWFYPFLWGAMAVWLVFVLYSIAVLRFGRKTARRTASLAVAALIAFVVGAMVYFTNWQIARLDRIFTVRYRSAYPVGITLSPDGQTIAVGLMDTERATSRENPRYVPVYDTPSGLVSRILRWWRNQRKPSLPPHLSLFRILFVSCDRAGATELLLPTSHATFCPWSPDSRRIVLHTMTTSATEHLWLAEPKTLSIKPIPGTSTPLLLLNDAWSSDGTRLKAVGFGPHPTARTEVVFHIESGRREVTSISLHNLLGPETSPDGQWIASAETALNQSRITVSGKKDSKPMASISVPRQLGDLSPSPSLLWSPNSRKLAIAAGSKTWIYDTETRRSAVVKTWRQAGVFPLIVWSPDSRSFYFTRSLAAPWIGLEIVRVTLRE